MSSWKGAQAGNQLQFKCHPGRKPVQGTSFNPNIIPCFTCAGNQFQSKYNPLFYMCREPVSIQIFSLVLHVQGTSFNPNIIPCFTCAGNQFQSKYYPLYYNLMLREEVSLHALSYTTCN